MTIDEFVTALAKTPGPWNLIRHITGGGYSIRRDGYDRLCCPITAMGVEKATYHYMRDAMMFGLSARDAETIATTADGLILNVMYDPALRVRLEAATVNRDLAQQ